MNITDEDIKDLFNNKYHRNLGNFWHFISNEYKDYIINRYRDSETRTESLYRIINNIEEAPKCEFCNKNKAKFKSFNKGYIDHCKQCAMKDSVKHVKDTCLKRYGVTSASKLNSSKEKMKQTCLEKYGVEHISQLPEFQEKIIEHNLEKYGVTSTSKLDSVKEKMKQTCLNKYGKTCALWAPEQIAKSEETCLKKYGTHRACQAEEVREKAYASMKKNHTYRTSKDEEKSYIELLKYFDVNDIERQYIDNRYKNSHNRKFRCDFYIKSLDLFIECNYSDFHHFKPFDSTDKNDIQELQNLKEKSAEIHKKKHCIKSRYDMMIYVWAELDIIKRTIAKQNNLNYLEFYTFKDFKEYFAKNNFN